jgi:division protein CdvB (Snf7/Vps24/ESCRT-III family)
MEAQAWTAIGLLAATLLGALFYLGNRIDTLGSGLRSEFKTQVSRIDAVSARMDGISSRMDEVSLRLDEVSARLDEVSVRLDGLRPIFRS